VIHQGVRLLPAIGKGLPQAGALRCHAIGVLGYLKIYP